MKRIYNRPALIYLAPLLLWFVALAYVVTALGYGPQARLLPLLVGVTLLIMLPIDLISISDTAWGRWLSRSINPVAAEAAEDLGGARPQLRALGTMLAFAALLPVAGIALATPLYIAGSLRILGRMSWTRAILTGAIVGAATYAMFELELGVRLDRGMLGGSA
jgi:hypothetical protein